MPTFLDTPTDVTPGTTGSFQDVDVTSYVGGDAGNVAGVLLQIINTSGTDYVGMVRKNGSSDDYSAFKINGTSHHMVAVGVDADDIFEAYVENAAIDIILIAYFTNTEAVFFTNSVQKQPASHDSTWRDIDISGDTGGDTAVLAFGMLLNPSAGDRGSNVRPNGSSDNFTKSLRQSTSMGFMVPVDGSEIYEAWSNSSGNNFRLMGYMKSGFTGFTNGIDKSADAYGSYINVDVSGDGVPAGSVAALVRSTNSASVDQAYAVRPNGSSFDKYYDHSTFAYAIVKLDADLIFEQKAEHSQCDLYLYGYFSGGDIAATITGVEGVGEVGTLVVVGDVTVEITGVQGAGQAGTLTAIYADGVTITGVQGTGQVGELTTTGDTTAAITGVEGTGHAGNLDVIAGVIVEITGVEGTGEVGDLGIGIAVEIGGVEGRGQVGELVTRQSVGTQIDPGHVQRVRRTPNMSRYDRRPP